MKFAAEYIETRKTLTLRTIRCIFVLNTLFLGVYFIPNSRGHSGLHAPLRSRLVSLIATQPLGEGMSMPNPCNSCGDSIWGPTLTQFVASKQGIFPPYSSLQ